MDFRKELSFVVAIILAAACLDQDMDHFISRWKSAINQGRVKPVPGSLLNNRRPHPIPSSKLSEIPALQAGESSHLFSRQQTPPKSDQSVITVVPCRCPFTPQYSPVCASDNQTYGNIGILNCYRTCGYNLSFARGGTCTQVAGRGVL